MRGRGKGGAAGCTTTPGLVRFMAAGSRAVNLRGAVAMAVVTLMRPSNVVFVTPGKTCQQKWWRRFCARSRTSE